jgi:hypothetical protein
VKGLNALQLATADANLYYRNDPRTAAHIDDLPVHWRSRRADRVRVKRAHSEEDQSYLVLFYEMMPDVRLDPSFVRVRGSKRGVPLRERARTWRAQAVALEERRNPRPRPRRPSAPSAAWRVIDDE